MIWQMCRAAAWVACKLKIEDGTVAGSDYIAVCYYFNFNQDHAKKLADEMFPEVK